MSSSSQPPVTSVLFWSLHVPGMCTGHVHTYRKTVIHSKLKLKNSLLKLFGGSQGLGGVEENEGGSYHKNALC